VYLPDLPGVFNVVHGDGKVGKLYGWTPAIAKVVVNCEVGTGKKSHGLCGGNPEKVTMETRGKSPLIVFDDADIDEACNGAPWSNF